MAVLRYVSDHIEQVIGGLVVLFLLTSILLLIRNINQKEQPAEGSGRSSADDLDIGAIETAMKRVLAAQGVVGVAGASHAATAATNVSSNSGAASSTPSTVDPTNTAQLAEALKERDTKVQELAREIDRLTTEVATSKSASGGAGEGGGGKVAELQTKIEELQARLSEYEIIEDDIADLSLFKEENAQLKSELETLKAQIGSGGVAPVVVAAPVAAAAVVAAESTSPEPVEMPADDFTSALLEEVEVLAETPVAATEDESVSDPFDSADDAFKSVSLDEANPAFAALSASSAEPVKDLTKVVSQDEIDALFALAPKEVEDVKTLAATGDELKELVKEDDSIFDSALDTEKMLSEVENLSETTESVDVLEGSLDTEKLLAEMDSIGKTPAATESTAKTAAPAAPFIPEEEQIGEDDLLAEFKDPTDGGQR